MNNRNFYQVPKETGVINITGMTPGKRTTRNKNYYWKNNKVV